MARLVDTVNMCPYHHGQLREALVDAALALARPAGPEAVVLRAVARQAGVSHNAAYRHFADRDALLRAVCERCMSRLAVLMEQRIAAVPGGRDLVAIAWAQLEATSRAYVEFATTEPGWFRTAFAVPRTLGHFAPGEGAGASGLNPYQLLGARLDALVEVGTLPRKRRPGAQFAAWSAVHGLAALLIDGPMRDLPREQRALGLRKVLEVVARGL
ncbi:MAG: TetR/AcrR family transcriptional regulator [Mycobacteriales bacterium]